VLGEMRIRIELIGRGSRSTFFVPGGRQRGRFYRKNSVPKWGCQRACGNSGKGLSEKEFVTFFLAELDDVSDKQFTRAMDDLLGGCCASGEAPRQLHGGRSEQDSTTGAGAQDAPT
jgi:hypothetical protein